MWLRLIPAHPSGLVCLGAARGENSLLSFSCLWDVCHSCIVLSNPSHHSWWWLLLALMSYQGALRLPSSLDHWWNHADRSWSFLSVLNLPQVPQQQVLCPGWMCFSEDENLHCSSQKDQPKINWTNRQAPHPLEQGSREQLMSFYGNYKSFAVFWVFSTRWKEVDVWWPEKPYPGTTLSEELVSILSL